MRVVTEEQMQEIDRIAIEKRRIRSLDLMERAGKAVADLITERFH
jgi:NAD(P)H-hydrate repair Nnr-like enzyme with NAD(P)H-hydrate epimerase domain